MVVCLPAAGGALEREGRRLEADDHHLEAQQPEVGGPALRELAEAAGAHGLEEARVCIRIGVFVGGGEGGAGLLEGGRGEAAVDGGEGAVALCGVVWCGVVEVG